MDTNFKTWTDHFWTDKWADKWTDKLTTNCLTEKTITAELPGSLMALLLCSDPAGAFAQPSFLFSRQLIIITIN